MCRVSQLKNTFVQLYIKTKFTHQCTNVIMYDDDEYVLMHLFSKKNTEKQNKNKSKYYLIYLLMN